MSHNIGALKHQTVDDQNESGKKALATHAEDNKHISTSGYTALYRNVLDGIGLAFDAIFGYNLGNVLKAVNVCVIILVGFNAFVLYEQLVKSQYTFTWIPTLLLGFITVACCFLFILNMYV